MMGVTETSMATGGSSAALQQLIKDDAVRQLRQQQGRMAAMMEQERPCFLLIIDGSIDNAVEPLHRFFQK